MRTSRPRAKAALLPVLALAALALLGGCASRSLPGDFRPPDGSRVLSGVPFHPQDPNQCGPASLAGILNHHGDPVTPDEIRQEIFREDIQGTVSLDLALYPRERGFSTEWFAGEPGDLVRAVDAGRPLLVMVDYGFGGVAINHYMVVVGYTPEAVVVNSGRTEHKRLPWSDFHARWDNADRWTLRVTPNPPHSEVSP